MTVEAVRDLVTASRHGDVNTPKQLRQRMRDLGYSDAEILEAVEAIVAERSADQLRAIAESSRLPGRATARAALAMRARGSAC